MDTGTVVHSLRMMKEYPILYVDDEQGKGATFRLPLPAGRPGS